jgi:hypothetical protein
MTGLAYRSYPRTARLCRVWRIEGVKSTSSNLRTALQIRKFIVLIDRGEPPYCHMLRSPVSTEVLKDGRFGSPVAKHSYPRLLSVYGPEH